MLATAAVTHPRRVGLVAAGLVAAFAVWAALVLWPAPGSSAGRTSPATALAFRLPPVRSGGPAAVLAAAPGQPVVLNFFAAWCDPCHAELPLLADLQRRMGSRLQVLGVDVQDNQPLAVQLLQDANVGFPTGYDPGRTVSDAWGVDGLPVTVFIGADGRVVDLHRGQLRQRDLDRLVGRLLVTGAPRPHRQS